MTYYNELLKLCAFDDAEIASQKERIERTFKIPELGPADMKRAEEGICNYSKGSLRTRLETFAEMLKARKAAA